MTEEKVQSVLQYTGERMVPEAADTSTFWEHIYRYRFACRFVKNRRVLDVACGEGYGTYGLSLGGAASVMGVDISEEACSHARAKYRIDARCGSATEIPLDASSVDAVVSFETVEHVDDPAQFVKECARVLAPHGLLIISTPNRDVYSDAGAHNHFHCSEMNEGEFLSLLKGQFKRIDMYSQTLAHAGAMSFRALSVHKSSWTRVRGYWLMRKILSERAAWFGSDQKWRESPWEAITAKDPWWSNPFNPYGIRRRSPATRELPTYFIAVCRDAHQAGDLLQGK